MILFYTKYYALAFVFISNVFGSTPLATITSENQNQSLVVQIKTITQVQTAASQTITTIPVRLSTATTTPAPSKKYFINYERNLMINQINIQRSGLKAPLLCQDSLLSSMAQQHANNMAASDILAHDLPCSNTLIPNQFCASTKRLERFGKAAENIVALTDGVGSAAMAMTQISQDASKFASMMNPDYLYVGVGMAMSPVSGKYYWVQIFSQGNYQGVSCVIQPTVVVLDSQNRPISTVQPIEGLNMAFYPQGITNDAGPSKKNNLYCTLIPFHKPVGSQSLLLDQIPYPTITFSSKKNNTLTSQKDTISILSVVPTSVPSTSTSTTTSALTSELTPMSTTLSAAVLSGLAEFKATNSEQRSAQAAMSTIMANPSLASAAVQMAQFITMAAAQS